MSDKTKKIISIALIVVVSLMLTMSGVMKLAAGEEMVKNLSAAGLGAYVRFLGIIELLSLALFIYPKTYKFGFLLLCSYLGGALSIELAHGKPPVAAVLLAVLWTAVYLRNKNVFFGKA
jgi:hypothetical protein